MADFGAEFISRYLKANNLRDISDCREYPSYLKINFADFSLIKGLISWANHCAEYIEILMSLLLLHVSLHFLLKNNLEYFCLDV